MQNHVRVKYFVRSRWPLTVTVDNNRIISYVFKRAFGAPELQPLPTLKFMKSLRI